MRDVIATKDGPQAIGPYSQAIRANGFVFVSGQVAIDPANQQVISGDVAVQTERVLKNLSAILDCFPQEHGRLHGHERSVWTLFQVGAAGQING